MAKDVSERPCNAADASRGLNIELLGEAVQVGQIHLQRGDLLFPAACLSRNVQ